MREGHLGYYHEPGRIDPWVKASRIIGSISIVIYTIFGSLLIISYIGMFIPDEETVLISSLIYLGSLLGVVLSSLGLFLSICLSLYVIYIGWKVIQDDNQSITPGLAIGLLFIPIFNYVWIFFSIRGLVKNTEEYAERRNIHLGKSRLGLATSFCVLTVLSPFLSYILVGLITFMIAFAQYMSLLNHFRDRINRISTWKIEQMAVYGSKPTPEYRPSVEVVPSPPPRRVERTPAPRIEVEPDEDETREFRTPDLSSIKVQSYYKMEKPLGTGGFSDVYLATDSSGKYIAIKKPHTTLFESNPKKVESRFLKEAQNWSRLVKRDDIQNRIVNIHTYGLEPEPFIAMEYMDSGSLRDHMDSLSLQEKMDVIKEILGTLHIVHHLGVIHRDIKPENILKNSQGQWKMADWGLSKVLIDSEGSTTQAGSIKATLSYAAPEQVDSDTFGGVDWRTDIYQVGVLAYELFVGKKPFEGEYSRILFSIISKDPPDPASVRSDIPKALSRHIMRAMERRKEDRWQDANSFIKALDDLEVSWD